MKNNPVLDLIAADDPREVERNARIALSYALVPGDASISPLLRTSSAAAVLDHLTQTGGLTVTVDTLRQALALAHTPGHRVLIPGDADWPVEFDALGDIAPITLWVRGDATLLSRSLTERVTVPERGLRPGTESTRHPRSSTALHGRTG